MPPADNIVGNVYDKYRTNNPVARLLMHGFLSAVTDFYRRRAPRRVLEVGCGEGHLAHRLVSAGPVPAVFEACDLALDRIAPGLHPLLRFRQASIYDLPYPDGAFDLVVCCEVVEHLERPERALAEVARVAAGAAIVSAPREPLWRILNVARGKYLAELGNTPGHVQHFSGETLVRLVDRELRVVARRNPIPWTVLLAVPRRAPADVGGLA